MTVLDAVRLSPSPPARVESTMKETTVVSSTEHEKPGKRRRTKDGDIRIVRIQIDKPLSFSDVRLSRELEVLDAHRIEHDFENVKHLGELTEEEHPVAVRLEPGQHFLQLLNLARRHPLVVLERVLLQMLQDDDVRRESREAQSTISSPCSRGRTDAAQSRS
jgi:hypothetical protein